MTLPRLNAWISSPAGLRLREGMKRWGPFGCGVAGLAIGFFFVVAWHVCGDALLRRLPLGPMKYNTALCLCGSGLAIALLALHRSGRMVRTAGWLGWLVAGFGSASLLEYLTGWDLGIDRLFFNAPDAPGDAYPDRMSLLTAVCFSLLGLGLGLSGREFLSRRRLTAVGIAGCVVGVMVSMGLVGYAFGINPKQGWGVYARMSAYATLGLFLCSAGLLVWARREARRGGFDFSRWLPLTASLTLIATIALISATSFAQMQDSVRWRRHSHEVLATANAFLGDVFDINRGMRGYALTGKKEMLDTYRHGAERGVENLRKLAGQVKDNPSQSLRLEPLKGDLDDLVAYSLQLTGTRGAKGIGAVIGLEADGSGFLLVNQTLDDLREFTEAEERLLADRRGATESHFRRTLYLMLFGCAMAAALLLLAHGLTHREMRRRRGTEKELQVLADRFTLAAEASQTGVWDLDVRTGKVTWDRRMYALYGIPEGTPLVHETWAAAVLPEDLVEAEAGLRRVVEEKGRSRAEFRIRLPDGTVRHLFTAHGVRLDAGGRVTNVVGVNIDITERKRMELALHEKNVELENAATAKNRFLANMSHELRTPLNCIIGFSELLVDGLPGAVNAEQKEYLGDILTSSNHLLQLINDVLDLAKVESGKIELLPEPFSVRASVERVCAVVYPIVRKKRIELTSTVEPGLDVVTLDPKKFKQILYNLLSNAVKFTEPDGCVDIRIDSAGVGYFAVAVRDTGIGIRPEHLPRLFREFEQLDDGYSRSYQGTGLGLALTRKLVEMQGGTIRVESVFGKGSLFVVTLPLASAAEARP